MAGFFDCVTKVYPGALSSLPTVDMEEECISPLSEEEEQEDKNEDIKVVERKCFLASSKSRGPQSLRKKAGKAREEAAQGRGCKTIRKAPTKAAASVVDTERSEDVESSARVSVKRQEKDESGQTIPMQRETQTTRSLKQQTQEMLHQKKASEEELSDDSDATICELPQVQESPKVDSQRERETSTTLPETQTDNLHMEDLSQTEDEPESQSLLSSVSQVMSGTPNNTGIRTKKKHKDNESTCKELSVSHGEPEAVHAAQSVNILSRLHEDNMEEPSATQVNDEIEFNEGNCVENVSHDVSVMTQEEKCVSDSTPKKKKKKRKKDKSFKENVREEVDGNVVSDLGIEDSVLTVSCKLDKEKRKRSHGDVEQLQLNTAVDIKKKKKKGKREKTILDAEEHEEEDTSSKIADLVPESNGHSQVSGNGSENGIASGETPEPSYARRKKHKKKHHFSPNDAVEVGKEGADVSFSNVSVTLEGSIGMPQKWKKKKTKSNELDISYTNEENEKVEDVDGTQKAEEDLKDQDTQLVTNKKKKKKKRMHESNMSEDDAAQNTDSVSTWKKEKKRASSFLVADTEEKDINKELNSPSLSERAKKPSVITGDLNTESGEITGCLLESSDEVKKKKRKKSVKQDSMEKDNGGDFEQQNRSFPSPLPETTEVGVKEKKGTELVSATSIRRLENVAEFKHSSTYRDSVLKKKKKKCKDLEGELLSTSADLEPRESKTKKKKKGSEASAVFCIVPSSPLLSEKSESAVSPSNNDMKNKKMKVKRRLHNPNETFLTDSWCEPVFDQ